MATTQNIHHRFLRRLPGVCVRIGVTLAAIIAFVGIIFMAAVFVLVVATIGLGLVIIATLSGRFGPPGRRKRPAGATLEARKTPRGWTVR